MSKATMARWLSLAAMVVLLIVCLFWLFVGYRALSGASNHMGFDVTRMRYVALLGMALFVALWIVAKRGRDFTAGVLCALSLAGSYALDHYNFLVPYEVWLKRGMPERMSTTQAATPTR
jgi:glucan phosphoethanolaminetransferase (alkaline phosphatase superfamily)